MNPPIKKTVNAFICVVALASLLFLYKVFNPESQNYFLFVNSNGTPDAIPLKITLSFERQLNKDSHHFETHLPSRTGGCCIVPYDKAFFGGELTVLGIDDSVLFSGDFLPPGRYRHVAVVSIGGSGSFVSWDGLRSNKSQP